MDKRGNAFGGLIVLLLVLVVFIVALGGDNISGRAVDVVLTQWDRQEMTTIEITPDKFVAGEKVSLIVYPGKGGVTDDVRFYRASNNLRVGRTHRLCDGTTCFEPSKNWVSKSNVIRRPFNYVTSTSWEKGRYYVAVEDDRTRTWVRDYFEVI
ncbi:hypothetical protein CL618_02040 [archaeon]|nr:hypothetical protein [archaeon]|tara:strand:- start:1223 stop:1681 length:459 start_codon:yes stop_codon:yes gene_type:complete